jgi:RNA polymerase sigma-70 factor (ECF subfamily)
MLGSFDDAEDLLQETLLRAWRGRHDFAGRSSERTWLYRIATNACLDFLAHSGRRARPAGIGAAGSPDVAWLQPYPDRLLDQVSPLHEGPEAVVVERETIELVFIAALQLLSPRERAVLILRDIVGWTAAETAGFVDSTVAAVNSALQRARSTLRQQQRVDQPSRTSSDDDVLVRRYIEAHERGDADAVVALVREDFRIVMPPDPRTWESRAAYVRLAFSSTWPGKWRLLPGSANRQPMVAFYLAGPDGLHRPTALQVLRIDAGLITQAISFRQPTLFPAFGLPPTTD